MNYANKHQWAERFLAQNPPAPASAAVLWAYLEATQTPAMLARLRLLNESLLRELYGAAAKSWRFNQMFERFLKPGSVAWQAPSWGDA